MVTGNVRNWLLVIVRSCRSRLRSKGQSICLVLNSLAPQGAVRSVTSLFKAEAVRDSSATRKDTRGAIFMN